MAAFDVAEFTAVGMFEAVVSAVIGLALLHRAYGLWNLQRGAWLITLILLGLRAVFGVFLLIAAPSSIAAWVQLVLVVTTLLYLIQPGVREVFSGKQSGV